MGSKKEWLEAETTGILALDFRPTNRYGVLCVGSIRASKRGLYDFTISGERSGP